MWLPINRIMVCTLVLLGLAGCGFEPVYGKHENETAAVSQFGGVQVDPVSTDADKKHLAQELRTHLEDSLNPDGVVPANPAYRLKASLLLTEAAIGVSRDGTVSRYNVYLTSSYTLIRNSDNQAITSGTLQHVSSYNNLANIYYSTYVSQQDAAKQGIGELAELYRQRLAAYFNEGAPIQAIKPTNDTVPAPVSVNPYNPSNNPLSNTGYPYP